MKKKKKKNSSGRSRQLRGVIVRKWSQSGRSFRCGQLGGPGSSRITPTSPATSTATPQQRLRHVDDRLWFLRIRRQHDGKYSSRSIQQQLVSSSRSGSSLARAGPFGQSPFGLASSLLFFIIVIHSFFKNLKSDPILKMGKFKLKQEVQGWTFGWLVRARPSTTTTTRAQIVGAGPSCRHSFTTPWRWIADPRRSLARLNVDRQRVETPNSTSV